MVGPCRRVRLRGFLGDRETLRPRGKSSCWARTPPQEPACIMLRITTRYFAIDRADNARRVRTDDAWAMLAWRPPGVTLDVVPPLPQREPGIVVLVGVVLLLEAWRPR